MFFYTGEFGVGFILRGKQQTPFLKVTFKEHHSSKWEIITLLRTRMRPPLMCFRKINVVDMWGGWSCKETILGLGTSQEALEILQDRDFQGLDRHGGREMDSII